MLRFVPLTIALAAALPGTALPAQTAEPLDRVVLQFENAGSRVVLSCHVVEYTGESISVRPGPGYPERTYPASQVVSVETPQTKSHLDGAAHFAKREYDLARPLLETALGQEPRGWVRREILALLVRCALGEGDRAAAASRFILLATSDPTTHHFKLIPLDWGAEPPGSTLVNEARHWMSQSGEVARLLGASVLLGDERSRDMAAAELKKLQLEASAAVRGLARAQLWRLELNSPQLDPDDLRRWQAEIERMPEDLRAGPYFVLGQASLRLRQYERAAVALLWLPLVADHDHRLAARACLDAAGALRAVGRNSEAVALCREITERFGNTPFAQEAAALLVTLSDVADEFRTGETTSPPESAEIPYGTEE